MIELSGICKNYQMDKIVVKAVDDASFKIEKMGTDTNVATSVTVFVN